MHPVTPEVIAATREKTHALLKEAQFRSDTSGKPLLILVGEHHLLSSSAMLETIIYQEARVLGIKDVALEADKGFLSLISRGQLSRMNLAGVQVIEKQARYFGTTIHAVDGRMMEAVKSMEEEMRGHVEKDHMAVNSRNESIAANLANIHRPILMITGAKHLAGLLEKKALQNSHEIVTINVSQDKNKTSAQIAGNHLLIHNLDFPYKTDALRVDQFFTYGLGADEGQKFLHWAKEQKLLFEPHLAVDDDLHPTTKNPSITARHLERSIALYNQGRDAEAGVESALFETTARAKGTSYAIKMAIEYIRILGGIQSAPTFAFQDAYERELNDLKPHHPAQSAVKDPQIHSSASTRTLR